MTISYPRDIPTGGINGQTFEIQRVDYQSPETSGRIGGVTAGFPLWTAKWKLGAAMSERTSGIWRAWVASLRGSQKRFYGKDVFRKYPLAYAAGFGSMTRTNGSAFDGTTTSWSVDGTRSIISLNSLPNGFTLLMGDYLGFLWGTSNACTMARVLEDGAAGATGILTLTIEPPLPNLVPANALVRLQDAVCLMRLTNDTSIGDQDLNRYATGTIAAIQDLIA